jgi:hypothetical protein
VLRKAVDEVVADAMGRRGRVAAKRRTSLDVPPEAKPPIRGLDRLQQVHPILANEHAGQMARPVGAGRNKMTLQMELADGYSVHGSARPDNRD